MIFLSIAVPLALYFSVNHTLDMKDTVITFHWACLLYNVQEQADTYTSKEVAESMGLLNKTLRWAA